MVKLIALDIDGTLLTSSHQISPATRAAVQGAVRQGVQVVLASARSPEALRRLMVQLGIEDSAPAAIAYTGALLCRLSPRFASIEVLDEQRMPLQSARAVVHLAQVQRLSVAWFEGNAEYISGWDAALRREFTITGVEPVLTPDLLSLEQGPHKLLCIAGQPKLVPGLHTLAAQVPPDCTAQFSHANYLEITRQGVNKADALAALGRQFGIAPAEMAALGDQENDIGMLKLAGVGIAMGNAVPAVKAVADWVTESNDRDGVALALERLQRV